MVAYYSNRVRAESQGDTFGDFLISGFHAEVEQRLDTISGCDDGLARRGTTLRPCMVFLASWWAGELSTSMVASFFNGAWTLHGDSQTIQDLEGRAETEANDDNESLSTWELVCIPLRWAPQFTTATGDF